MTYVEFGRLLLISVPIYASSFFWGPGYIASCLNLGGMPVHEIIRRFGIRERLRVCVAGVGFGASLFAPAFFGSGIAYLVTLFCGLGSLVCVDAWQIHAIARSYQEAS